MLTLGLNSAKLEALPPSMSFVYGTHEKDPREHLPQNHKHYDQLPRPKQQEQEEEKEKGKKGREAAQAQNLQYQRQRRPL